MQAQAQETVGAGLALCHHQLGETTKGTFLSLQGQHHLSDDLIFETSSLRDSERLNKRLLFEANWLMVFYYHSPRTLRHPVLSGSRNG